MNRKKMNRNKLKNVNDYTTQGNRLKDAFGAKYFRLPVARKLMLGEHINNMTKKTNNTRGFYNRISPDTINLAKYYISRHLLDPT